MRGEGVLRLPIERLFRGYLILLYVSRLRCGLLIDVPRGTIRVGGQDLLVYPFRRIAYDRGYFLGVAAILVLLVRIVSVGHEQGIPTFFSWSSTVGDRVRLFR